MIPVITDGTGEDLGYTIYTATVELDGQIYTDVQMQIKTFTVNWYDDLGNLCDTTTVEYGELPEHDAIEKQADENEIGAYTFMGWAAVQGGDILEALPPVEGETSFYAVFSYTGWRMDEIGKQYFIDNELQKTGLTEIDGNTYYLDPDDGYAAVSTIVFVDEADPGHAFDENGVWMEGCAEQVFTDSRTGDVYLIQDGIVEVFPGLYKTENNEYYYFGEENKAYRGEIKWVEKNQSDPEDPTDRGLLPKWDYEFGDDGIIVHESVELNGIQETEPGVYYYYIDGIRVHYGMFYLDGYYYYADRNGKLITSKTYWCSDNYTLMPEGPYTFDEFGRMIIVEEKNGIYEEDGGRFFYKDGSRYYAGLVYLDEETKVHLSNGEVKGATPGYYYVRTSGELVLDRSYWITKNNDLADQFPEGAYPFDAEGRMMREKNGIYEEDGTYWYYVNGLKNYAGVIQLDATAEFHAADGTVTNLEPGYYYAKTNGEIVHGRSYWISKTNGLLPEKAYQFEDSGKMIVDVPDSGETKEGLVWEDGKLWYYVNGKLNYAGLIEIDGSYYYIRTSGEAVVGRSYWITKTNDIPGFQQGSYDFDNQGRLILP